MGCDLLRYAHMQDRLWPELEGVDRLVLLGDVWEMSFQHLGSAVESSRSFFAELERRFADIEVLYLPGNHDHHLVIRAADEHRERQALGLPEHDPFTVAPAARLFEHLCPRLRVRTAYPLLTDAGVCFTHGHYLSSHLDGLGWRTFDRLGWLILHKERRSDLSAVDYEALITPLHEFVYQVAQLPDGVRAQQEFERLLGRLAGLAGLPGKLGSKVGGLARDLRRSEQRIIEAQMERLRHPFEGVLRAMDLVMDNLAVGEACDHVVFGHTHTPFVEQRLEGMTRTYHNAGSWFYDHRELHKPRYWELAAPGSVLRIDGGDFELRRVLEADDVADLAPRETGRSARRER